MTAEEITRRLQELPGWSLGENQILRDYRFDGFSEAFAFMTACALEAEKMNHHPDWSNVWATVRVRLSTHDAGGITDLDFQLASKMEALARRFLGPA
jgi:4a-hydroxytetrahydrobiopterin dehydratase